MQTQQAPNAWPLLLQISGPTGPMTVVMAAVIAKYRDQPAVAFTVVSLAGLLQVCCLAACQDQLLTLH